MTNIQETEQQKEFIKTQVVYALPEVQKVIDLQVESGTTIQQAIEKSGIMQEFSEINLQNISVGIYAKLKNLDHVLHNDDRIEIYRDLKVTKKVEKTNNLNVEI